MQVFGLASLRARNESEGSGVFDRVLVGWFAGVHQDADRLPLGLFGGRSAKSPRDGGRVRISLTIENEGGSQRSVLRVPANGRCGASKKKRAEKSSGSALPAGLGRSTRTRAEPERVIKARVKTGAGMRRR
jgi:hypothetical protein